MAETARDSDVDSKDHREFILALGISWDYNMTVDFKRHMQWQGKEDVSLWCPGAWHCTSGKSPGDDKLPAGTQLEDIIPRGTSHSYIGSSSMAGAHHSHECEQQVSGVKHPVLLWTSHVGGTSPQFGISHNLYTKISLVF
jgi:hypothetical protein